MPLSRFVSDCFLFCKFSWILLKNFTVPPLVSCFFILFSFLLSYMLFISIIARLNGMIFRPLWDSFISVVLGSEFCCICCVCWFSPNSYLLHVIDFFCELILSGSGFPWNTCTWLGFYRFQTSFMVVAQNGFLCLFGRYGFRSDACTWCWLIFCFL